MKNENIPYFMWDERLTKDEIKRQLIESPVERKISLMAKIMRDARLQDVWEFISVNDIVKYHNDLFQQLGWHKDLWVFLYNTWIKNGLLQAEKYIDKRAGNLS